MRQKKVIQTPTVEKKEVIQTPTVEKKEVIKDSWAHNRYLCSIIGYQLCCFGIILLAYLIANSFLSGMKGF
jgi:hypothetical protein